MPRHKDDVVRAIKLAAMDYYILEPVIPEMFRWLRTFKSPIADVFIEFFTRNAFIAAEDVGKMLSISKQEHLKYTIVTQVLPEWPASALRVCSCCCKVPFVHVGHPLRRTGNSPHDASSSGNARPDRQGVVKELAKFSYRENGT